MQTVIETPAYLGDAKALGLTDAERAAIVNTIAQQPSRGDVIPGTGGRARSASVVGAKARVGGIG